MKVFAIPLSRFMFTKVKRMFIGMVPSLVGKNRVRFSPFQSASQIFGAANLVLSSSLPFFRSLYFHKATRLYLQRNSFTSVCWIRLSEKFIWFSQFKGGRSASVAANAGVSDRLFKRHGRWWKTDQAKDGYIKDKLESLLSGYKSLHI